MYFEELRLGDKFVSRDRLITGTDIDNFAISTGAVNPLFLDNKFAREMGFEARIAPGVQVFEKLIGDQPALIMLDEFAAFLRKAQGIAVVNSTLAEQSSSFLLSLLSFAAKMQKVVVVITLADSKDAFAAETEKVQSVLVEAGKVTATKTN